MPRYQITSPDGRVVTIEGPNPPTQEDAQKIFATLPPKTAAVTKGRPQDMLGGKAKPAPQEKDTPREVGGLLADIALEGGGATAGQALGALAAPYTFGASIPLGGAVGGVAGNLASQKRRILAGEQPKYRFGEALSSALTGAIPGIAVEAAGAKAIAREALRQGVGGISGKALETVVDEGRIPSLTEAAITTALPALGGAAANKMQQANPSIRAAVQEAKAGIGATERATFEAGIAAGYKLPPSEVNPTLVNRKVQGIAGKEAVNQGASIDNQPVTDRLAKKSINHPEHRDITPESLDVIRKESSKPYQEIGSMAETAQRELDDILAATSASSAHETAALRAIPETAEKIKSLTIVAAADVKGLREARAEATKNYQQYNQNGSRDADALNRARAAEELADTIEANIDKAALEFGRPGLVDDLKTARTRIARTYDIEHALNEGVSQVSAPALGAALRRGRPLGGELQTIAKFALAYPSAIREAAKIPTPGVSKIQSGLALMSGLTGMGATGSGYGLLAGALPFTSDIARGAVLSRPYQYFQTRMPLTVDARPDVRALATRALAQEAAQELAEEAKPKKKP